MKLGIDLKIDYAFKWTFGSQSRIKNLRSLLEHTLQSRLRGPIHNLTILNPIQDREFADGKLSVLDILAQDASGVLYHIEMQIVAYPELPKRFLFYTARTFVSQLEGGQEYEELEPTISIFFVNSTLFPNLPGYHHCFKMSEPTSGQVFCDDIEMHLIELPKFKKRLDELQDGLDQWIYLIKNSADLDPNHPPVEFNVPEVSGSLKDLRMLSQSKIERYRYLSREKAIRDEIWKRNLAAREIAASLEKGLEEGREQMRRCAKLAAQINSMELKLGRTLSPIDDLLDLPEDELQRRLQVLNTANTA